MTHFVIRMDMRDPSFAKTDHGRYAAAIDMVEWADRQGFSECMLSEHHGAEDGYLPSPLVLAGAIASRTNKIRIRVSAIVLPLHDPLRVAEDVAVVDRISGGRIELVIVAGFRPQEYAMFGKDITERGRLLEEGLQVLKLAWSGEAFEYRGTEIRVTPTPVQKPHPPLLVGGGAVAARRAARLATGFVPTAPHFFKIYQEECVRLGIVPEIPVRAGSMGVFVAENPDELWQQIAPHALHETNSYSKWYAEGGTSGAYQPVDDAASLRKSGLYQVLTPEECICLARDLGENDRIYVHPLLGGLEPEIGWETLRLLEKKVLPALKG